MALQPTNAPSSGILGAIRGALNLFSGLNKSKSSSLKDNFNPAPIGIYESELSEMSIISLVRQWKEDYEKYFADISGSQTIAFEYWLGKHKPPEGETTANSHNSVDNKIFEAVETFIPIATRSNPDPVVKCDPSDEGQKLSAAVKSFLVYEADRQKVKKKLKRALRHWLIYKIAAIKSSYNTVTGRIETEVINPKRFIFDVDGHIDESGKFTGQYIGEKKQASADKLAEMFPANAEQIKLLSQNKKGTKLEYIEWWYKGRDVFYTMDALVLGKYKNPHWNYDIAEETEEGVDENGAPVTNVISEEQEGKNFLDVPTDPYTFLSIFSTGLQPHDETSLITQNIGLQDMVNRRWNQIDKNVEAMNNGLAVSNVFTAEQASQAATALRKGTAIRVPTGDVNKAVMRLPAPGIPADVYNSLKDSRAELLNIFGTSGSVPSGQANEKSVRGKILVNQLDTSRIGGGITEYLEQMADTIYNYWIQLMFVHFDEEHYFISAGSDGAPTLLSIKNTDFLMTKTIDVTVKDGSLIPKDPLTQRNEAIDLWSANAIDPLSLYRKLDFPDPSQATNQLILWQMLQKGQIPPQVYLPTFSAGNAPQGANPALQGQPNVGGEGVGGNIPNPIGPPPKPNAQELASPEAVASQEKQLLRSVPIPH